jgi:hypothetical protein
MFFSGGRRLESRSCLRFADFAGAGRSGFMRSSTYYIQGLIFRESDNFVGLQGDFRNLLFHDLLFLNWLFMGLLWSGFRRPLTDFFVADTNLASCGLIQKLQ